MRKGRVRLTTTTALLVAGIALWAFIAWTSQPDATHASPYGNGDMLQDHLSLEECVLTLKARGFTDKDVARASCSGGPPGGGTYPPPLVSIVFVLDGSDTMVPRVGGSYFELAREAIIKFLEHPGMPLDASLEVGVVQFADLFTPGYDSEVHWLRPRQIHPESREYLIGRLQQMPRSQHFSGSLMEMGIREATSCLTALSTSTAATQRHMILLTSGEYRVSAVDLDADLLPDTCPPTDYTLADPTDWAAFDCRAGCEALTSNCNRACPTRYQAWRARKLGIKISTIRLGPDWRDQSVSAGTCLQPELANPYGTPPTYCPSNPAATFYHDFPAVPSRDGFLKELANWNASTEQPTPCAPTQPVGKNIRINPFLCSYCEATGEKPGNPAIIAETIADWLCDLPYSPDGDNDGHRALCDNCPYASNPHQRDCDRDGIGDACQLNVGSCGSTELSADADGDGLCNGRDFCLGGDNCLIAEWLEQASCSSAADCHCDCDNNGKEDLCQHAQELFDETLVNGHEANDSDQNGIPDYCDADDLACQGAPALCDVAAGYDPGDPTQIATLYVENFDAYTAGEPFIAQAQSAQTGWWLSGETSSHDHVRVVSDSSSQADGEASPYGNVVEFTLDTTQPTNGLYEWFIESRGLILPETEYTEASSTNCGNGIDPGPWGVIAIKVDLLIDNRMKGPIYDLYLLDPCEDFLSAAKRVHLQFRDDPTQPNRGTIWMESNSIDHPCGTPEGGMVYKGQYVQNEWFQTHIEINTAEDYFWSTADQPIWNGGGRSVRVGIYRPAGTSFAQCNDARHYELGTLRPFTQRGVQLRLAVTNRDCDCSFGLDTTPLDDWTYRVLCPGTADANGIVIAPSCADCRTNIIGPESFDAWATEHCANVGAPNLCGGNGGDCDIADCSDNCPRVKNKWQTDSDNDGWGDACDGAWKSDDDDDGVWGVFDNCASKYNPRVPFTITADPAGCARNRWGFLTGIPWQPDRDCDGLGDPCDNCPTVFNPGQVNSDNDSNGGDACDPAPPCTGTNSDNDAYANACDNCDSVHNNDQLDSDGDRIGNLCDPCPYHYNTFGSLDADGDGFGEHCDNCPARFNRDQANHDRDSSDGDACDGDLDLDEDGLDWDDDSCPYVARQPGWPDMDSDNDGIGDDCDNCPGAHNNDQRDTDNDGRGDDCEPSGYSPRTDIDGDGWFDGADNCYTIPNPSQSDADCDKVGDACDGNTHITDCDLDGAIDQCPPEYPAYRPCLDATSPNPGRCMCLSLDYPFMLNPPQWIRDIVDSVQGGIDGGECPFGPCDETVTCQNKIRLGKVQVRRTHYCEWNDWYTPEDPTCAHECVCGGPDYWHCE